MEFVGEGQDAADGSAQDSQESSQFNSPRKGVLNTKSTICGDCTVVEDIEKEPVAPVDRLLVPGDIVEIKEDDEQIFIIGTKEGKVTKIRGLEVAKNLKVTKLSTTIEAQGLTTNPNHLLALACVPF
jgi:hypothetical protein